MIKLNNVTFTYRSETGGGIREIDLSIPDGQVVVLCGESGCGKTTLTRLINGLIPHYFEGELSGSVEIACASAFMMEPQVFVLDEPSSNLDADAILDLREVIAYLKSLGKTVVLSEHRLYYLRGIADRYLYMSGGRICGDYTSAQFELLPNEERKRMGLRALSLDALTADGNAGSGRTAYIITHDPELICECCTDIIHLEDGRIKACYPMDAYGLRWVRDFFRIGETMSC